MSQFPNFTQHASCAEDSNPDAWFPEEVKDPQSFNAWIELSDTPEAKRARSICNGCPAYDECMAYSLQFSDLTGIWAGLDTQERKEMQKYRRMNRKKLKKSYSHYEVNQILVQETGVDAWR